MTPTIVAAMIALAGMKDKPTIELPIDVTQDIEYAREICRSLGNPFSFDRRYTDKDDFNGDGVLDYIIDTRGYFCGKETEALFGGSSGMPIYLYLSNDKKGWSKEFNAYAFEYNIKPVYNELPYFDVWIRGEVGYQVNYQRMQWNGDEMEIIDQEMGVDVPNQLWKEFD